jgi:hypothetical protein
MGNGLKYEITEEEFNAEQDLGLKMNKLFKVLLNHQRICGIKSGEFSNRLAQIETDKKINKATLAGIGIGSGGGVVAMWEIIKSIFHNQ